MVEARPKMDKASAKYIHVAFHLVCICVLYGMTFVRCSHNHDTPMGIGFASSASDKVGGPAVNLSGFLQNIISRFMSPQCLSMFSQGPFSTSLSCNTVLASAAFFP